MTAKRTFAALALALATARPALAQPDKLPGEGIEPAPAQVVDIDVDEKLGDALPLDLTFIDETGERIRLGSLFEPGKPVILTFNYSNCPVLCSVQLSGLVQLMRDMRWSAGAQFQVITVGIDPTEPLKRRQDTKAHYVERYARPGADDGWRFLSGDRGSVKQLADAVGFTYRMLPNGEYVHPAVLIVISPSGTVAHYAYGVQYPADAMASALAKAALGDTVESSQKFILSCFHYEAPEGYSRKAESIMRYAGIGFAVIVAAGLILLGVAYRRRASQRVTT